MTSSKSLSSKKVPSPNDNASTLLTAINDYFLNETQLAEREGVSVKKLQADRLYGVGCPYHKFGRAVRYRLSDVLAYESKNLINTTNGVQQ